MKYAHTYKCKIDKNGFVPTGAMGSQRGAECFAGGHVAVKKDERLYIPNRSGKRLIIGLTCCYNFH